VDQKGGKVLTSNRHGGLQSKSNPYRATGEHQIKKEGESISAALPSRRGGRSKRKQFRYKLLHCGVLGDGFLQKNGTKKAHHRSSQEAWDRPPSSERGKGKFQAGRFLRDENVI